MVQFSNPNSGPSTERTGAHGGSVFGGGRGGAAFERLRESAAATAAGCGPAAGRPRSAARAQGNDSGPALVFTPFVGRSPFQGGDRPKQSALPSSALTRILIRTHFFDDTR